MPLRASIDLGNEYFRVEHISDAKDVKVALAGFSAGKRAAGLELYLKKSALTDEAECDARTYLVRDVVTDEVAVYFSLRTCLVPFQFGDGGMYTIPGIELSNFARNVNYRSGHKGIEKVGGYVFFRFVLPLVQHVSSLVGAQLLCLYALPDPHLIRYYEKTLGFSKLEDPEANFIYGHIKPKYDQDCVFMCRRI